jgi:hypothetical protein
VKSTVPEIESDSDPISKEDRGETLSNVLDQANNNSIFSFIVKESGIYEKLNSESGTNLSTSSTSNSEEGATAKPTPTLETKPTAIGTPKNAVVDQTPQTISQVENEGIKSREKLTITPASLRDPVSLFLGIATFVVKPFPFLDNGSFFVNALSYESFFWYPIYGLLATIIHRLIRDREKWNLASATAIFFILGFLIQSALLEINVGTAFRHRPILLLSVLILCGVFMNERESSSKLRLFR